MVLTCNEDMAAFDAGELRVRHRECDKFGGGVGGDEEGDRGFGEVKGIIHTGGEEEGGWRGHSWHHGLRMYMVVNPARVVNL